MSKAFYINDLVIDSNLINVGNTCLVKSDVEIDGVIYDTNYYIFEPNLFFRSTKSDRVRVNVFNGEIYDVRKWNMLDDSDRDILKTNTIIKDINNRFEYDLFGKIIKGDRYLNPKAVNSRNEQIDFKLYGDKFDFGDILFSTDLDYLKGISILE